MPRRKRDLRLATWDTETDPFERGGEPVAPFTWGFYERSLMGADIFNSFWGDDCIPRFINFLECQDEPYLIYAHNGGKFDFLFMLKHIAEDVTVINGRIVSCRVGIHEFRDSYAILPVALSATGDKGEIDYKLMRRGVRHLHKRKIVEYMKQDCVALYDQVTAYRDRFGIKLTMAGAAITKLKEAVEDETEHPYGYTLQRLTEDQDRQFRPFFFGGRVECFEKGVINDSLTIVDRISMYPTVMADREHPTGNRFVRQEAIDDRTDFCIMDATAEGCFPLRAKDNSLTFPHARAVYRVTGHEARAAMELGKVTIHNLIWAAFAPMRTTFAAFVNEYYALRKAANAMGDKTAVLHYKLVLNSSYGRFALNPDKLQQWAIVPNGEAPTPDAMTSGGSPVYDLDRPWSPAFLGDDVTFWRRNITENEKRIAYMNVATGASITGAARADLFRAIRRCERPIYCDTDSIMARVIDLPPDDGSKALGAWAKEAEGSHAFIAGKKLYALADAFQTATAEQIGAGRFVTMDRRRVPVLKMASKGVRLTGDEIAEVARGGTVTWEAEAPSITIAGVQTHMKRVVRMR